MVVPAGVVARCSSTAARRRCRRRGRATRSAARRCRGARAAPTAPGRAASSRTQASSSCGSSTRPGSAGSWSGPSSHATAAGWDVQGRGSSRSSVHEMGGLVTNRAWRRRHRDRGRWAGRRAGRSRARAGRCRPRGSGRRSRASRTTTSRSSTSGSIAPRAPPRWASRSWWSGASPARPTNAIRSRGQQRAAGDVPGEPRRGQLGGVRRERRPPAGDAGRRRAAGPGVHQHRQVGRLDDGEHRRQPLERRPGRPGRSPAPAGRAPAGAGAARRARRGRARRR